MKNKRLSSFFFLVLALVLVFALSPAAVMAEGGDGQGHFFGYKFASKHTIGPDDSLTYTVLL